LFFSLNFHYCFFPSFVLWNMKKKLSYIQLAYPLKKKQPSLGVPQIYRLINLYFIIYSVQNKWYNINFVYYLYDLLLLYFYINICMKILAYEIFLICLNEYFQNIHFL
jgi:hypothetical protein